MMPLRVKRPIENMVHRNFPSSNNATVRCARVSERTEDANGSSNPNEHDERDNELAQ